MGIWKDPHALFENLSPITLFRRPHMMKKQVAQCQMMTQHKEEFQMGNLPKILVSLDRRKRPWEGEMAWPKWPG